jgi:hypothetical protein
MVFLSLKALDCNKFCYSLLLSVSAGNKIQRFLMVLFRDGKKNVYNNSMIYDGYLLCFFE